MNIDRAVFALAGTLTLLSLSLAVTLSPWWLLLAGFVGANQLQASLTRRCPAANMLGRLGVPTGCAFETGNELQLESSKHRQPADENAAGGSIS